MHAPFIFILLVGNITCTLIIIIMLIHWYKSAGINSKYVKSLQSNIHELKDEMNHSHDCYNDHIRKFVKEAIDLRNKAITFHTELASLQSIHNELITKYKQSELENDLLAAKAIELHLIIDDESSIWPCTKTYHCPECDSLIDQDAIVCNKCSSSNLTITT